MTSVILFMVFSATHFLMIFDAPWLSQTRQQ